MALLKKYLIFDHKVPEIQQLIYGWIVLSFILVLGLITVIDLQTGLQWQTLALRFFCLALFILSVIIGRLANSYQAATIIFCVGMLAEVYPNVILTDTAMRLEVFWYPIFVLITGLFLNFRAAFYLTLVHTLILFIILQKNLELGTFFESEVVGLRRGVTIELQIRFFCAILLSTLFALKYSVKLPSSKWLSLTIVALFVVSTWFFKSSPWGEAHPLFQASFLWILLIGFIESKSQRVVGYFLSVLWVFFVIEGHEFEYDNSMRLSIDYILVLPAMAFNFVVLAYIFFNEKHSLKHQ